MTSLPREEDRDRQSDDDEDDDNSWIEVLQCFRYILILNTVVILIKILWVDLNCCIHFLSMLVCFLFMKK